MHIGDNVLVKEADSKLAREGIHEKLADEHGTGPWQVTDIEQPTLSYQATLRDRRIRGKTVSAAKTKAFYETRSGWANISGKVLPT